MNVAGAMMFDPVMNPSAGVAIDDHMNGVIGEWSPGTPQFGGGRVRRDSSIANRQGGCSDLLKACRFVTKETNDPRIEGFQYVRVDHSQPTAGGSAAFDELRTSDDAVLL